MAWPMAIAALGSGALGAISSHSAASQQNDIYSQIIKALQGLKGEQRLAGQQALDYRKQGLDATRGGFNRALQETTRLGESAELDARELATQEIGQANQSLASRGMFNPEAMRYARVGIQGNLARNLGALAERVASVRAGLHTQGGLAEAGALGGLAGQVSSNFDQRQNLVGAGLDFMAGSAPQGGAPDLSWLFAGLGAMGGGGGSSGSGLSVKPPNMLGVL
jgi:hypothetical protein